MFSLHQELIKCTKSKTSTDGNVIVTVGFTGISIYKIVNGYYELFQKIDTEVAFLGELEIASNGKLFICRAYDNSDRHVLKIYEDRGKYELKKEFVYDGRTLPNNFGANLSVNDQMSIIVTAKDGTSVRSLIHILEEKDGEWTGTTLPKANEKERNVVFPKLNKKGDRITVETSYGFQQDQTRFTKFMFHTYEKRNEIWEKVLTTDDVIEHLSFNTQPGDISISYRNNVYYDRSLLVVENDNGTISVTKLDDKLGGDRYIKSYILPAANLIIINSRFNNTKKEVTTSFRKIENKWQLVENPLINMFKTDLSASKKGYLLAGNKVLKLTQ
jgi:hypothetical protein